MAQARAFWTTGPSTGEIRFSPVPDPGAGEVLVHTLRTGVSRGTETLVFQGRVPPEQRAAMRAPYQTGDLPGPVKYGYLAVGRVAEGPSRLVGRRVFCLHPHQSAFVVPESAVTLLPDEVPDARAVLTGTVETAVNALWDAAPLIGDRVSVVGAGMVGCTVARLLARMPGVAVTLVDIDPARAATAAALGVAFATPEAAEGEQDLVIHASASEAGLRRGLELLAPDATLLELSWYGDREVTVPLGSGFHSRRLAIKASQVGAVAPAVRHRRTTADRLRLAVELLKDPAFDALLADEWTLEDLPQVMAGLASGELPGLCHTVRYDQRGARGD